jgi:hypothetical protein
MSGNSLLQDILLVLLGALPLVAHLCGQLLDIVPRIGALAGRAALARLPGVVDGRLQRALLGVGLRCGAQRRLSSAACMSTELMTASSPAAGWRPMQLQQQQQLACAAVI